MLGIQKTTKLKSWPCLDKAIEQVLINGKSPSRKVGELDTRGSHFYLALYWAKALAAQNNNLKLKERFKNIAASLTTKENQIVEELTSVQGTKVDLGGYFLTDPAKTELAMRPSRTFNDIIDTM